MSVRPFLNNGTARQVQSEFVRRGISAINRTLAAGDGIQADTVIAKLESKRAQMLARESHRQVSGQATINRECADDAERPDEIDKDPL